MNESLSQTIMRLTLDSLKTENNLPDICSKLRNLLVDELGGIWQVFSYKVSFGNSYVQNNMGKFINFRIADLNFAVFQTDR